MRVAGRIESFFFCCPFGLANRRTDDQPASGGPTGGLDSSQGSTNKSTDQDLQTQCLSSAWICISNLHLHLCADCSLHGSLQCHDSLCPLSSILDLVTLNSRPVLKLKLLVPPATRTCDFDLPSFLPPPPSFSCPPFIRRPVSLPYCQLASSTSDGPMCCS